MTTHVLTKFAARYAQAWSSHDPERSLPLCQRGAAINVNGGPPTPIVEVAHGFLRDFPDMIVKLERRADRTAFHWTLTGTYAGRGTHPRISGYELWKIGDDGLIAESSGQFDAAEYERQVKHGVDTGRGD